MSPVFAAPSREGRSVTPVSADRRARLAMYLALLCGYIAGMGTDPLASYQLAAYLGACLWSLLLEHRVRRAFFSPHVKIGLIIAGSVLFITLVSRSAPPQEDFAGTIGRFLFWNAIVFVLSRSKSEYDLWTLGIIDVSLFMISAAFFQPTEFLPLFGLSCALLLYSFMRAAMVSAGPAETRQPSGAAPALVQLALMALLAASVFVLFPRGAFTAAPSDAAAARGTPGGVAVPPDVPPEPPPRLRTGFSARADRLDLADLATIVHDPQPAFELQAMAEGPEPAFRSGDAVYLRGWIFDVYREGSWTSEPGFRKIADADDKAEDEWVEFPVPRPPWGFVRQNLVALIDMPEVVPAIAEPMRIRGTEYRIDPRGMILAPAPALKGTQYEILSAYIPHDASQMLPPSAAPAPMPPHLTELPPELERVRNLAAEITEGRTTMRERIEAIRSWLTDPARFRYLTVGFETPLGVDRIEHFLLVQRRGYCMHFATAMALLARACGIPARFAAGFHASKPIRNPDGSRGVYVFRLADAHAWAEIAVDGVGWISIDATPPASLVREATSEDAPPSAPEEASTPTATEVSEGAPAKAKRWDHWIVDFNPMLQSDAARRVFGTFRRALDAALSPRAWILLLSTLAAGAAVYALLPTPQRSRVRQLLSGFRDRSSVDFYQHYLWLAARRVPRKPAGWTGREYADLARRALPADAVEWITEKFYAVRYGGATLDAADRAVIDGMLRKIEAASGKNE
ncbi:MAG: transglutaminase domain-containing protein [Planctomycetes bacterium]|nr:transglutaminase domain-containing protein [Planctomycetota bacterium]